MKCFCRSIGLVALLLPLMVFGQDGYELTTKEAKYVELAKRRAKEFLRLAVSGNLKGVKNLCSRYIEQGAPSAGEGDEVIGFTSGREMKQVWARKAFKIVSIEFVPPKERHGPYYLVWLHPTKGKWDGDTALVYSPKAAKFVSVYDASE